MENASKALIMAGEVLISIIIISALVLMFNNLTSYQSVKEQNEREAEVIKFNNKYEAYNRDDVRGNDLYSLINGVVNYNKKKSTEGEEGQDLAYQPITINVNLKSENGTEFTPDGRPRIFEDNKFTINSTNNTFKNLFEKVTYIESNYPIGVLNNLATGLTTIYVSVSDEDFDKYKYSKNGEDINKVKQIIYKFNSAYGSAKLSAEEKYISDSVESIKEKREDVYTYYEYLQFTRAHFKCTGVKYNSGTGRIVEMNFQFTGEIN